MLRGWFWLLLLAAAIGCVTEQDGQPPRLTAIDAPERARGVVSLWFELANPSGAPLTLAVQFRDPNGQWRPARPAPGSSVGSGLYAGEGFVSHRFLWDSLPDLGEVTVSSALRVRVANTFGDSTGQSADFTIENGNAAPQAAIGPIATPEAGALPIQIGLADAEGETVAVSLRYSLDGAAWQSARLREPSDSLGATPNGSVHLIHWEAAADIGWGAFSGVRLAVQADDGLGYGPSGASDPLDFSLIREPELRFQPLQRSLRGEIPIGYELFGMPGAVYDVELLFWLDGEHAPRPYAPLYPDRFGGDNRVASPEGVSHSFMWDSIADLGANSITRRVGLVIRLYRPGERGEPLVEILDYPHHIDNAPLILGPVISELYSGVTEDDAFIELAGPPGYALEGMRLYERWRGTQTGELSDRAFLALDGYHIGEDGLFVIAGPNGPPADLVWDRFHTFYNEDPYSMILDVQGGTFAYDAVGVGDFTGTAASQGNGVPLPRPPFGQSLQRELANTDIEDNSLDFIVDAPTPGKATFWPEWTPDL